MKYTHSDIERMANELPLRMGLDVSDSKVAHFVEAYKQFAALLKSREDAKAVACHYCDGTGDVHSIDGAWRGECKACPVAMEHAFKNFHKNLCERFGYMHDEVNWRRDQVSLEEFIAKKITHPPADSGEVIRWQDHDGLDVWTIRPTFGEPFEVFRRNQLPTKQQGTDDQWDAMSDYEKGEVHGWNECVDAMSVESREKES